MAGRRLPARYWLACLGNVAFLGNKTQESCEFLGNTKTMMRDLFQTFARIGLYSFGGPAAQIALMHRVLVEEKGWLREDEFLNALSFTMLLPGPEAMQLATYAGWRRAGHWGGVIAGLLFVMPGAAVMAALASVYVLWGELPAISALLYGLQATVMVIVLDALLKLRKRALQAKGDFIIAALSFLAIFAFSLPFPIIIAAAALWGFLNKDISQDPPPPMQQASPVTFGQTCRIVASWAGIWAAPILTLYALDAQLLKDIAVFFSKLALVTFGGAYALLSYLTQTVVSDYGWINTREMMHGLGLAETTPGPLILVTQFVGFLAGFKAGGFGEAFIAAMLTLWVTFVPCFLWIFAGAPYVERLIHMPRLRAALRAITATVLGVILNLAIWFGLHVIFETTSAVRFGPVHTILPNFVSFDPVATSIAAVSALLLLQFRCGLGWTLLCGGLLGVGMKFI